MAADYIPRPDAEFDAWLNNFVAYISANAANLDLDPIADIAPITAAMGQWQTDYAAQVAAQTAAQSATQTKEAARAGAQTLARQLSRTMQANPNVDDAEKAAMGITVPDTTATPTGPPTTRPLVTVDCSQRLQHTIGFMDELTPTRKAKPDGVLGAEVWVKVGNPAPVDPSELMFLALDTATPYVADYGGKDGGVTAHYMLRWVSSGGDKGPWSETASATISA